MSFFINIRSQLPPTYENKLVQIISIILHLFIFYFLASASNSLNCPADLLGFLFAKNRVILSNPIYVPLPPPPRSISFFSNHYSNKVKIRPTSFLQTTIYLQTERVSFYTGNDFRTKLYKKSQIFLNSLSFFL